MGADVPYQCTIDVRTHTGPYGVPTGPLEPHRDPTVPRTPADRRRHRRTPLNRSLPGLGGPQRLLAQPRLLVSLPIPNLQQSYMISHQRHTKTSEFNLVPLLS